MAYRGLKTGTDKARWASEPAALDAESLRIEGHPVMEAWEQPYMAALAAAVSFPGARVLEVGFGLGLASRAIQSLCPSEHVIIEANGDVYRRLVEFAAGAASKVTPRQGLWEEVVPTLESASFDGILYDTYPLSAEDQHVHQFAFVREAMRLLKPGGKLTYCNLTSTGLLKESFATWDSLFEETQRPRLREAGVREEEITGYSLFPVSPPSTCKYFRHDRALVPVLQRRA
jgi:guanidinoacetate N-methyltransferase